MFFMFYSNVFGFFFFIIRVFRSFKNFFRILKNYFGYFLNLNDDLIMKFSSYLFIFV